MYVFNSYDRVRQIYFTFFETSNDRGDLLIPSNAYTSAANKLYFDNISCS